MQTFTASSAKQNFGALISHLALGPVTIERHHKAVAVIMAPESAQSVRDPRQAAREAQRQRELQRLLRHQQLAIEMLCATPKERQRTLQAAQKVVQRWQTGQLCSADYIARWQQWLALPMSELALLMCSPAQGWGAAMRQNSPFAASRSLAAVAHRPSLSKASATA